ncbi:TIR domain-containing protein [Oleiharenicola sp. Vm1]|uniref:TIR domain-containing protein n=1 Tax=Oleiharenicola sp. Vm1 TaxID=3398393 RepID=UPI0039F5CCC1
MGRRVFFSFHHQHDSWRVAQVRNSWLTKGETNQFMDAAAWESVKKKGDAAVKRWIDNQLHGTSVTAVLVGTHTAKRRYVRYEIEQSLARGNGLLAIFIHGLKDRRGETSEEGPNPLDAFSVPNGNSFTNWLFPQCAASSVYPAYYWINDNGRENLNDWIEDAARRAGR